MALLDISHWPATRFDVCEQVEHMASDGWGDVFFKIFFGVVFGILIQFHNYVAVQGFSVTVGNKVITVDAEL